MIIITGMLFIESVLCCERFAGVVLLSVCFAITTNTRKRERARKQANKPYTHDAEEVNEHEREAQKLGELNSKHSTVAK